MNRIACTLRVFKLLGCLYLLDVSLLPCAGALAVELQRFKAMDSLAPKRDSSPDAQACLETLSWQPGTFQITCEERQRPRGRNLVRYPSPVSTGDVQNDLVALDWYVARNAEGQPLEAPAVLVIHESGSDMAVGRMFAYGMQLSGIHAFMIHLPHYGERRSEQSKVDRTANLVPIVRQALADVRRGYDTIAVLPYVDTKSNSVQGTSLGGFVAATAASLDGCFQQAFILLAGGDLHDVITCGQKDSAKIRERLSTAGYTGERLKDLLWQIEPTRLTHRLDPTTTWLYSAKHDRVVPLKNANLLAKSVGLEPEHHLLLSANHYSGIVYFPVVLEHIVKQVGL